MTDEEFQGYYPGSKVPVGEPVGRTRQPLVTGWDNQPVRKFVGGGEHEFFNIGAVCKALGRPPVTIRLWIRQGHLPNAPFKMPDRGDIKGRRMWKREHIEALIRVAAAHDLLDTPRVDWSKHSTFKADVLALWAPPPDDSNT